MVGYRARRGRGGRPSCGSPSSCSRACHMECRIVMGQNRASGVVKEGWGKLCEGRWGRNWLGQLASITMTSPCVHHHVPLPNEPCRILVQLHLTQQPQWHLGPIQEPRVPRIGTLHNVNRVHSYHFLTIAHAADVGIASWRDDMHSLHLWGSLPVRLSRTSLGRGPCAAQLQGLPWHLHSGHQVYTENAHM